MPLTSDNAPHIVNDKALGGALVLGFTWVLLCVMWSLMF